ncbi:MAG: pyridoxine 5-phosphate synthase [Planctomycetota bacterium]|jgi:pyridoxine 5-phosphate synthase
MPRFFVNVDHIATVREARKILYPSPVRGVELAEAAGVDGITIHLREDRRHINDQDVWDIKKAYTTEFNLEIAVSEEIVSIAESVVPDQVTIVPEKREEVTTEGGLNMVQGFDRIQAVTRRMQDKDVLVSLFIDPDEVSVKAAKESGATHIELHTGSYANAVTPEDVASELAFLEGASAMAQEMGLIVNAGHGLHYENTAAIARIPGMQDLNIGHSIIAESLFVGLPDAIKRMKSIVYSDF